MTKSASNVPSAEKKTRGRLTTEEFIARALSVHGDRYDYSAAEYMSSRQRVTVICREHGPFRTTLNLHVYAGNECPACYADRRRTSSTRMTTEDFVERAREVHGDRYDYTASKYAGQTFKLTVTCLSHGDFETTPNSHVHHATGCQRCAAEARARAPRRTGGRRRVTAGEFAARAHSVHGDRYDYSRAEYQGSRSLLVVGCRVHGDFHVTPNSHLHGRSGCPACGKERHRAATLKSIDEFISDARAVHGHTYDYSRAAYQGIVSALEILCPVHGSFWATPNNHVHAKSGCPTCEHEAHADRHRKPLEEFIAQATAVHRGRYSYENANYRNMLEKVAITCRAHGDFLQRPEGHLRGAGCATCAKALKGSIGEREVRELLTETGIEFYEEWTHPSLVDKRQLRFDFCLPATRTLIEYDGIFHHRPVLTLGRTKAEAIVELKHQQRRDAIKNQWAADNGWTLIRLINRVGVRPDLIAAGVIPGLPIGPSEQATQERRTPQI